MFDELVLSHELKALASIRILQSLQNSAATTYETEDQDVVMEDTLPVPTQEVEFQQLQEELTSDDDMSFRDESDLESLFSDETISSNTSVSLQDHQRDATILLTDLLHKHRELYALYRIASMRVSSEKLQRHLRGFFRQYSRNLTNEARNDAERQAAAFVRSKAGYVARNIQGEVDGTKTTLALPQDSVSHMENTVNRWLASTTGSEEPQVKGLHSKKNQVTESQVTEPQTTKLRDQRLLGDRSSNLGDPTYNSSSDTTRHEKERKKETEHEDGERDDTEALSEDDDLNTPYTELDEVRHFLLSSQAFISLRSDLRRWLELDPRPRSPSPSTGSDDNEKPPRRRQVLEVSDEAREVLHYDIASAIKDDGLESSASLERQPVETDVVLPVDDVEVHWEDSLDREATDPQKDDASMQKEPLRGVEGKPKAYGQTNPERANETSRSGRILNAVLTMMSVVGIIEAQIPRGHQRVRWTNVSLWRLEPVYTMAMGSLIIVFRDVAGNLTMITWSTYQGRSILSRTISTRLTIDQNRHQMRTNTKHLVTLLLLFPRIGTQRTSRTFQKHSIQKETPVAIRTRILKYITFKQMSSRGINPLILCIS